MQREEQSNALSRRHWTITLYMAHHFSEEDFETNIVLARELRRLQEQIALQHVARKRIWASSFNLNTLSDLECLQRYRFKRKDVGFLATLIDWKKGIDSDGKMRTLRKRYLIDPVEATAIMLRRLSTANRLIDLQPEFGKHRSALSEIFYHALELFYCDFGSALETWQQSLVSLRARTYAKCVENKGSPLDSVVGFIDGTGVEIARPSGTSQRASYSGHKRQNCLKFQAISAPDGLLLHLFGPVEGRRHDMFLYNESRLDNVLRSSMVIADRQYYLYGDPAYTLRPYLQVGFKGSVLGPDEVAFNFSMSKVRVTVEWAFRDVKQYFTHLDVPRKLRLRVTPAGLWYVCAAMLWNFRVCLYGSQAAQYFNCNPIDINQYLEHIRGNQ
jgi:DDE superfamily endonuclease